MATSNFQTQKYFDLYASEMVYNPLDDDGNETDEYYFDYNLYERTEDFIDTLNKQLNFFEIELQGGYYSGIQTIVHDTNPAYDLIDFLNYYNDYADCGRDMYELFGYNRHVLRQKLNKEIKLINNTLLPQLKNYTFDRYGVVARFSNGETIYEKY